MSEKLILPNDYKVFEAPNDYGVSQRKLRGFKELAEFRAYYNRNPVKFMEDILGAKLLDSQAYCVQASWDTPYVVWVCSRGYGKAICTKTRLPTPNGFRQLDEIGVGDYVFGDDGKPARVIHVSPTFYDHDCYKMTFSDGEEIVADADHIWTMYKYGRLGDFTTAELAKEYRRYWNRADPSKNGWEYLYKVDICKPLEYKEQDLLIDPYILGLWLGDGSSWSSLLTVATTDLEETVKNIEATGYKVYSVTKNRNNKSVCIHTPDDKPLITLLRQENLFRNKHIPQQYLYGSIEQRLALLQGLMDTDGTVDKYENCSFVQCIAHEDIVDDTVRLIESLGMKTSVMLKEKTCNGKRFKAKEVYFRADKQLPVFRMRRKYDRLPEHRPPNALHKSLINIEQVESVPTKCLMVDNDSHLFLCGNKNTITHNSTLVDLILMSKCFLNPNYMAYIAAGSSEQSIQTFQTLYKLAHKSIESMPGLTDLFKQEVEIKNATGDGFVRNPAGNYVSLYNGSMIKTLNSNINLRRGARANMVMFDETGWLSEEMLAVYAAFTIVNKDMKLGGDIDQETIKTLPKDIANQLFYVSSASSISTPFYQRYREFSKQMLLGNKDYFVAEINCDVVINATVGGKVYPASLLKRETVETEMRNNSEKASREFFCRFSDGESLNNIIKRAWITRNSYTRKPILHNDTNERKICLFYDPARSSDNSIMLVTELYKDEKKGYMMDVINCVSFADISLRKKTPMRYQEQIAAIHELLLDYNGDADDYENIEVVMADAGAGGGGNSWFGDSLMEDWVDNRGNKHRGLIDKEYSEEYVRRFPNAINKLRLMNPGTYKSEAFEALIKMVEADLITFPAEYDNKGYINLMEIDEKVLRRQKDELWEKINKLEISEVDKEERLQEELAALDIGKIKTEKLSVEEEVALKQIDAMKEEIVNICRTKRESGKDSFKLPAYKDAETGASEATMHDDRAYCLALAGWYLSERRMDAIRRRKKPSTKGIVDKLPVHKAKPIKKTFG
ncbi:MAG: hypothetical protein LUB59_03710 [Candidatus Gastranaerophilales bacterium]|nr:hypothetical protein [Candidatus Gastranaerophilales bacterium]